VLWLRRPYFYAATLAAMGAISVQGGYRAFPWWSLVLWALALGIRFLAWVVWVQKSWSRAERRRNSPSPANRDERMRSKLRASEARRARWWDPVLVTVGVVIAFLVPWLLVLSSGSGKGELAKRYQERPAGSVGRSPNTLGLFLVADNQFHELGGRRTGGSLSLVEAVVSVASRPIALDLLSGASFEQLRTRYQALDAPELGWAHLGDIGDLGCEGELGRMGRFFERMGYGGMLGVAVGNHDLYFTGNFAWHPDWAGHACEASSVLSRERTLDRLRELPGTPTSRVLDQSIPSEDGFFSRLVLLGKLSGRKIVGVFLDTSNYGWWNLGLAGLQGGISDSQVDWIETALSNHADAHVVVFQHHPLDELVLGARTLNVDPMLEHLGSRLIAIVSAHTHLSALREHYIGGRSVPEFIVGSTTDAPQEGALLEIGSNPTTLAMSHAVDWERGAIGSTPALDRG
jgi:hypothetical protein